MNNYSPNVNVNWVPGLTLDEMEKQCILKAFQFYRQNKTQTAGALGISIRTLDNKLERYNEDAEREQERAAAERQSRAEALDRMRGPQITKQFGVGSANQIPFMERPPKAGATYEQNGYEANARVRTESTEAVSAQQPMSMPQRSEVQSVPSKSASASGNGKRRS